MRLCKDLDEVVIAGGGQVYTQALPFVTKIIETGLDAEFEGDTFFPDVNVNNLEIEYRGRTEVDDFNKYACNFFILKGKVV